MGDIYIMFLVIFMYKLVALLKWITSFILKTTLSKNYKHSHVNCRFFHLQSF